ncbi:secondary thiamine-phosphate synthase enzyme YjbQ [Tepidimicrobium xylanilyticum]|uniref:Secondary thiamine-phosphate synthase enzyme n=1 Tax=Tepidimicrobium xylanilyticum TaxID=1123352 RepID=A0A1H3APK4_9FIRM|nr:secondary thiamine-phosphate synthase enzyme YjbQ [Tepidimicrobium xylanilyticum]GMG97620.1 hypothetical protein EN5CB1_24460 [Tepidimicrobium xylanilyticum]SDX31553.1 secondary thiamine-phosphate synthase enzyme [Tepidimicrobium xylanilyticum]
MEFQIRTSKEQEFIDITSIINEAIRKKGIENGTAVVFVPHTTAGITINENADPTVVEDMLMMLNRVFPVKGDYRHYEGNSHAHIKTSLMGSSCSLIIRNGKLKLGTWQGVYFCEFDGPRTRKIYIDIQRSDP